MIVYIAGKISGDKDYKEKFENAQKELELGGHIVLNPAFMPRNAPNKVAFPICMKMIEVCDIIYLLPDWMDSKGARLEKEYADYLGKGVAYG